MCLSCTSPLNFNWCRHAGQENLGEIENMWSWLFLQDLVKRRQNPMKAPSLACIRVTSDHSFRAFSQLLAWASCFAFPLCALQGRYLLPALLPILPLPGPKELVTTLLWLFHFSTCCGTVLSSDIEFDYAQPGERCIQKWLRSKKRQTAIHVNFHALKITPQLDGVDIG